MGLDMYLLTSASPDAGGDDFINVAYWRKFNALHGWFVSNVQGGLDDCEPHKVTSEDLKLVLSVLKQVNADHSKASSLLPTRSGFFFGGVDYDEMYFGDVSDAIDTIEEVLEKHDGKTLYYESSW